MKIENIQNGQYELNTISSNKDTIYISKDLFEEAKKSSHYFNKTAVIFNNQVMAIENEILKTLKDEFKQDFKKYENILIAKNKAEEYLKKISNYVLAGLNVANADKNQDGMITIAESLDTRNIVDEHSSLILKPRDVLPLGLINIIEKDNSNFMSVNDILNLHISLDKNKDGVVTIQEITEDENIRNNQIEESSNGGGKDILDELYERQRKLQKQITQLTLKMSNADEEQSQMLQDKLAGLNSQLSAVTAQIMAILKERMGK